MTEFSVTYRSQGWDINRIGLTKFYNTEYSIYILHIVVNIKSVEHKVWYVSHNHLIVHDFTHMHAKILTISYIPSVKFESTLTNPRLKKW